MIVTPAKAGVQALASCNFSLFGFSATGWHCCDMSIQDSVPNKIRPYQGEIEEAARHPNGWVYCIAGKFDPNGAIPPEAIAGAWKVDAAGKIVGDFVPNPKYDPKKWAA
jgi:hypothetical protein